MNWINIHQIQIVDIWLYNKDETLMTIWNSLNRSEGRYCSCVLKYSLKGI